MKKPPPLTEQQKRLLRRLEPRLRQAAKLGDFSLAKEIAEDLQRVLRPTGHHVRLFQNKRLLFEAAIESGEIDLAIRGLQGIRHVMSPSTRTYVEATALLAICHLRRQEIEKAKPYVSEVLQNEGVIKSAFQRREFKRSVICRFDEEAVLAALRSADGELFDPDELEAEAGKVLQTRNEDEILVDMGERTPQAAVDLLLMIDRFAKNQLPVAERLCLPGARLAPAGEVDGLDGAGVFFAFVGEDAFLPELGAVEELAAGGEAEEVDGVGEVDAVGEVDGVGSLGPLRPLAPRRRRFRGDSCHPRTPGILFWK